MLRIGGSLEWHAICLLREASMNDSTQSGGRVSVLAVSPHPGDHLALQRIFGHTSWQIEEASTAAEAARLVQLVSFPIVVCEARLADGTWMDVLRPVRGLPHPAYVVVASHDVDAALWSDVLEAGAYDILRKPFAASDVFRTIGAAWWQWNQERRHRATHPALPSKPRAHACAGGRRG